MYIEDDHFRKEKSVQYKAKGPTQKFSYKLMTPNLLDQEIQKFLPHLFYQRFVKKKEKKEVAKVFPALRWKRRALGLLLLFA